MLEVKYAPNRPPSTLKLEVNCFVSENEVEDEKYISTVLSNHITPNNVFSESCILNVLVARHFNGDKMNHFALNV